MLKFVALFIQTLTLTWIPFRRRLIWIPLSSNDTLTSNSRQIPLFPWHTERCDGPVRHWEAQV